MSYCIKGFVEGVKEAGGIPLILPIGDEDMARAYVSMVDKLILTGGQMSILSFMMKKKLLIVMTTTYRETSLS